MTENFSLFLVVIDMYFFYIFIHMVNIDIFSLTFYSKRMKSGKQLDEQHESL